MKLSCKLLVYPHFYSVVLFSESESHSLKPIKMLNEIRIFVKDCVQKSLGANLFGTIAFPIADNDAHNSFILFT